MPEESKTSDSLEGGIDSGIGAASAFAGAASAKAAASAGGAAGAGAAAGTAALADGVFEVVCGIPLYHKFPGKEAPRL